MQDSHSTSSEQGRRTTVRGRILQHTQENFWRRRLVSVNRLDRERSCVSVNERGGEQDSFLFSLDACDIVIELSAQHFAHYIEVKTFDKMMMLLNY